MSNPGYFYSPEDQEQLSAIQRKQALAKALLQSGLSDPGNTPYAGLANAGKSILGAFLTKRGDTAERDLTQTTQQKYTQDLGKFLSGVTGQPQAKAPIQSGLPMPANPSPQISNAPGSGPQIPAAAPPQPQGGNPPAMAPLGQPQPGLPSQSAPAGAQQQSPQQMMVPPASAQTQNPLAALTATGNLGLMQQFGPQLLNHQIERGDAQADYSRNRTDLLHDQTERPMTPQEKQAAGIDPKTPVVVNGLGVPRVLTDPNQITAYQQAEIKNQQGQLGLGYAQLNKPVSVGYGDTLVSPQTGKVVYGGQAAQSPLGPDGKPLTGAAYLATLPAGIASTAKAIAEYRQAPLSSMALRSPQGAALMQAVNQINPGYDSTQYGAKNKSRLDFSTGKNGNTVRSLNVAVQHLDQLGALSQALDNGNVQLFNKIGQAYAQQTGNPAPTDFAAAKNLVADEVVKAIVGSGGGVQDRQDAAATISRASSPQQLAGVIQTYQHLMGGQLSGLKQQYEKTTGLHDFEEYLAPETQAKLETHAQAPGTRKTVKFGDLP
jgi:hypothetical protein